MNENISVSNLDKAKILSTALPYIQKYSGKTVVIKYGGNAMISEELQNAVMSDIVLLNLVGIRVVLVHGGGPEISQMLDRVGKESRFVNGLRYTDEETMDIVQMVLAGKLNKNLVKLIAKHGGRGIGLCGLDGEMLRAERLHTGEDLGLVGEITQVNIGVISDALDKGYIPVIATIAGGDDGESYNINADLAASRIAAALKAEKILLMTDICGLLRDVHDSSSLIPVVNVSEVNSLKREGIICGGMIPKIDCCVEAVRRGVPRAHIIDGRVAHSILIELLSDEGIGTMFL